MEQELGTSAESNDESGSQQEDNSASSSDNQDTQDNEREQSNKVTSEELETFETFDGRKLSPNELYQEYQKMVPEFTRRSQRLKELEAKAQDTGSMANDAVEATAQGVDPDVRNAIVGIVEPFFEEKMKALEEKREQEAMVQARTERYNKSFDNLAKQWDGKDGKPKFDAVKDRNLIIRKMQELETYNPEIVWGHLRAEEIADWRTKQALRSRKGDDLSEKTGTSTNTPPKADAPTTLKEAGRRAAARVARH